MSLPVGRSFDVRLGDLRADMNAWTRPGGGQWVVCLHGIQSDAGLFLTLCDDQRFDAYGLAFVDIAGFGQSSRPRAFSYSIADQARLINQVVDQLAEHGPVHLVGHSIGGMIAILAATQSPQRVASLTSLEGNLIPADCGLSRVIAAQNVDAFATQGYERIKDKLRESSDPTASARVASMERVPAWVMHATAVAIVEAVDANQVLPALVNLTCPRLLLHGDANPGKGDVLAGSAVTGAAVPGADHFMMHRQPQVTRRMIADFIAEAAGTIERAPGIKPALGARSQQFSRSVPAGRRSQ